MILGVGSIKPNEKGDDEDEEPEGLGADAWLKLLNVDDDETLSLKSGRELLAMKANKANTALALRAVIRQAWGEYSCFTIIFPI